MPSLKELFKKEIFKYIQIFMFEFSETDQRSWEDDELRIISGYRLGKKKKKKETKSKRPRANIFSFSFLKNSSHLFTKAEPWEREWRDMHWGSFKKDGRGVVIHE